MNRTDAEKRATAVRLLALAITADTTEVWAIFNSRSRAEAERAGVVVTEDDADVQRMVAAYHEGTV